MRLEAYRRLAPETRHASLAEGRRRPCTVALLAAELAQGPGRRLKRPLKSKKIGVRPSPGALVLTPGRAEVYKGRHRQSTR